jgi:hypothetical protein
MKLHANAALSLKGRRQLCQRVIEGERTVSAAVPPSAYAAAKKALAATAAASSGRITGLVSQNGSSYSLDTTRWNGDSISMKF